VWAPRALIVAHDASPALFGRLVQGARAARFDVIDSDPESGRFQVRGSRPGARFDVQCYADGYAEIRPSGPDARVDRDSYSMSSDARREYVRLAEVLADAARGPQP
jgi:hypothetical protein